jgi:hypothetical protein
MVKFLVAAALAIATSLVPDAAAYAAGHDIHNRPGFNCTEQLMGATTIIRETPTRSTVLFEGQFIVVNGFIEAPVEVGGYPLPTCS